MARMRYRTILILSLLIFVCSVLVNVFLINRIIELSDPERTEACNSFSLGRVKSFCLQKIREKDIAQVKNTFLSGWKEDTSLSSGVLISVRLKSGNYIVLIDNRAKTYKLVDMSTQTIIQSFCRNNEHIFFVGTQWKEEKNTGTIATFDTGLTFRSKQSVDNVRNIRDCVGYGKNMIAATHSLGGLILNLGEADIRSNFGALKPSITSNHEIIRFDLDGDGTSEIYTTPTIDNESILAKLGDRDVGYLKDKPGGALEKLTETQEKQSVSTVSVFTGAYMKEIYPFEYKQKKFLLGLLNNVASQAVNILLYANTPKGINYENMGTIKKRECRSVKVGNFGFENLSIAIGCEKGLYLYSFDGREMKLEKAIDLTPISGAKESDPNNGQVHALGKIDIDRDGYDELIAGVDMDGIYVYNFKKNTVDKLLNLSQNEYVWIVEEFSVRP